MIGSIIVSIFIFILIVAIIIVASEGFKLTFATILGSIGLTWAYLVLIYSSFSEWVVTPALSVIFGSSRLTFYTISATMLFLSWSFIVFISIMNIIFTANKGQIRIFQNITESETDNL
ncbi:MAG: hypothetical protein ACTSQL_07390 [Promethearchaeota archaeon]